jgi:hypothetical protein
VRVDSWMFWGLRWPTSVKAMWGYVTFPCGYMLDAGGDGINLYYGARRHQCRAGGREHHSDPWPA